MSTPTPNLNDLRPAPPAPPPAPSRKRPLPSAPSTSGPRRPRLDANRTAQLQRTASFLRSLSAKLAPFARHARNDIRIFHGDIDATLSYLDTILAHSSAQKNKPLAPTSPTAYSAYLLDTCLSSSVLLPPSIPKNSRLRYRPSPSYI
jgi:hypothetical protein